MEDNNNIDSSVPGGISFIPETIDPKVNYLELEPENELIFIETDSVNGQIHSSSAIDSPVTHSAALSHAFLRVKNVSNDFAVLFKIQTTSPIHYRVKPSHGRIEVGETKEVQISMLSESKKSDKFLINAVPTFHPLDSAEDFNNQFNACPEDFIQKYRLKCVIPGSSGSGLLAATAAGGGSTGSVVNISSPVAPSLRTTFIAGAGDSMASINSDKSVGVAAAIQKSPAATSSVSSATASVATLQRELKEARAEIDRLRKTNNASGAVAKEWKDVLTAQYGAPPVLVLLVAIFAFMVGLLF